MTRVFTIFTALVLSFAWSPLAHSSGGRGKTVTKTSRGTSKLLKKRPSLNTQSRARFRQKLADRRSARAVKRLKRFVKSDLHAAKVVGYLATIGPDRAVELRPLGKNKAGTEVSLYLSADRKVFVADSSVPAHQGFTPSFLSAKDLRDHNLTHQAVTTAIAKLATSLKRGERPPTSQLLIYLPKDELSGRAMNPF